MFNDYFDFQSGLDHDRWDNSVDKKEKSGPPYYIIPFVAGILLTLACLIGIWVAFESGAFWVLAVGGLGVVCGYKYSAGPYPFASLGLAEVIAFIFMGVFPAVVAYSVQGQPLDASIFALSLPYALVISTMLLTNNIRDILKDQNIRRTVAIRLGRKRSAQILTVILTLQYISVIALVYFKIVTPLSLITFGAIPWAIYLRRLLRPGSSRADEINAMKWSAIHHWVFGTLFVFALWIAVL